MVHPLRSFLFAFATALGLMALTGTAVALPISDPFEFRYFSGTGVDKSYGIARPAAPPPGWDTPPAGWQTLGFDDSSWSGARIAYPAPASPPIPIPLPGDCVGCLRAGYIWHDPNRVSNGTNGVESAYFRRTFGMPELTGAARPFEAILQVVADDDFEVWFNGVNVLTNADFGTANDRGPDYIHTIDVTSLVLLGQTGGFATNLLAIHATDGALNNPRDVLYEHLAYQLRIRTVPEPSSLALLMAAALGLGALPKKRAARSS